jgi:hypothetical protein
MKLVDWETVTVCFYALFNPFTAILDYIRVHAIPISNQPFHYSSLEKLVSHTSLTLSLP